MSSELIPFHALPIYKESTDFVLTDEERSVIVAGEFRKALSKQGNAISKREEVLLNLRLFAMRRLTPLPELIEMNCGAR